MSIVGNIVKPWPVLLSILASCDSGDFACPADRPVFEPRRGCVAPAVSPPAALQYSAVIVTDEPLTDAFARLAHLHTLTGAPTQVVTVREICGANGTLCQEGNACNDTARAIKDFLVQRQAAGLRYAILGGGTSVVPSRQTSDFYANVLLGVSLQESFCTDHYFADLSDWDGNGDCVYGDAAGDSPDYLPELAVTRIPATSASELDAYIAKVELYLTAYDPTRVETALFLSNLAAASIPVDSALYLETPGRTLSLLPDDFAVTKLYSTRSDQPDATPLTLASETAALEHGANLVIHAGHGSTGNLTAEPDGSNAFSAAMAHALRNSQFPIMLSCACQAAAFANRDGCAGASFVMAPHGGGIGYLGNSTTGLGLAGGVQFIDEFLKHAFASPSVLTGDAVAAGHANLPKSDTFVFSGLPALGTLSVPVIDENAWRWTQKAVTYLGDGLLPIYTNSAIVPAPAFTVGSERTGSFVRITFQPTRPVSGTLTVTIAGNLYRIALTEEDPRASLTVAGSPSDLWYGFSSLSTLASYQHAILP
ncbi:MAG: hypothetical protein JXP73_00640 [Deltaproteobacteria bacterium]|nr:hypothetical protein [Deltaproteobacteria bacterium]